MDRRRADALDPRSIGVAWSTEPKVRGSNPLGRATKTPVKAGVFAFSDKDRVQLVPRFGPGPGPCWRLPDDALESLSGVDVVVSVKAGGARRR